MYSKGKCVHTQVLFDHFILKCFWAIVWVHEKYKSTNLIQFVISVWRKLFHAHCTHTLFVVDPIHIIHSSFVLQIATCTAHFLPLFYTIGEVALASTSTKARFKSYPIRVFGMRNIRLNGYVLSHSTYIVHMVAILVYLIFALSLPLSLSFCLLFTYQKSNTYTHSHAVPMETSK